MSSDEELSSAAGSGDDEGEDSDESNSSGDGEDSGDEDGSEVDSDGEGDSDGDGDGESTGKGALGGAAASAPGFGDDGEAVAMSIAAVFGTGEAMAVELRQLELQAKVAQHTAELRNRASRERGRAAEEFSRDSIADDGAYPTPRSAFSDGIGHHRQDRRHSDRPDATPMRPSTASLSPSPSPPRPTPTPMASAPRLPPPLPPPASQAVTRLGPVPHALLPLPDSPRGREQRINEAIRLLLSDDDPSGLAPAPSLHAPLEAQPERQQGPRTFPVAAAGKGAHRK